MIRTFGRMLLLSAVAVFLLHGRADAAAPAPPVADEASSLGRILEFQKKLNERIDYELLVQSTLDKTLDMLLTRQGIPYEVNKSAFVAAQLDKDVVNKLEIEKIDKLAGVTRVSVLKKLLAQIPNEGGKGMPTFILRRDHVEITTADAVIVETRAARVAPDDPTADGDAPVQLPLLAYAAFDETPLQDALKQLARSTESTIVLDSRTATKTKVTADLPGVPLEVAIQLLADMANLKLVRVANVYYVTSPKNARLLRKEEEERRLNGGLKKADSTNPPVNP
jgi:hypothetical protein